MSTSQGTDEEFEGIGADGGSLILAEERKRAETPMRQPVAPKR
jgi:hypothetical protein